MKRRTIRDFQHAKGQTPIVCLTAYTTPMAQVMDGIADVTLVGDSVGMVLHGLPSTVPVTLEMMRLHGQAVTRGTQQNLVIIDLPFGSYQQSPAQAFASAAELMQTTGAQAVKLEGGMEMVPTVQFLAQRGIPVMAHIGLQPQSVHTSGYRTHGKDAAERATLLATAKAHADAGAFGLLLECVEPSLAAEITQTVAIPTIGIGSGTACDGQVLVTEDLLGLTDSPPSFATPYIDLNTPLRTALSAFAADVRQGKQAHAKQ